MKKKLNIIILFFYCLPSIFYAQTDSDMINYLNWYDDIVGIENTGLYNGKQYVDIYANKTFKDTHPFFLTNRPIKGSVTYNEQSYHNIDLRYDIIEDELVVELKSDTENRILKLTKENVDKFMIGKLLFKNEKIHNEKTNIISGFYQLLYQKKEITLLKKHYKIKNKLIRNERLYYKFIEKTKYIINIKNDYIDVNSKSDIIKILPKFKRDIKVFYRTHKELHKSDRDIFMVKLFDKLTLNLTDES